MLLIETSFVFILFYELNVFLWTFSLSVFMLLHCVSFTLRWCQKLNQMQDLISKFETLLRQEKCKQAVIPKVTKKWTSLFDFLFITCLFSLFLSHSLVLMPYVRHLLLSVSQIPIYKFYKTQLSRIFQGMTSLSRISCTFCLVWWNFERTPLYIVNQFRIPYSSPLTSNQFIWSWFYCNHEWIAIKPIWLI